MTAQMHIQSFGLLLLLSSCITLSDIEVGTASWYGKKFHGKKTASGERFDMHSLTAAHKHHPFGTLVKVKNLRNGKHVVVRINDRGPYAGGRIIDLSYAAAQKLQFIKNGITKVELTLVASK